MLLLSVFISVFGLVRFVLSFETLEYPQTISSSLNVSAAWEATLLVDSFRTSNDHFSLTSRVYCYNGGCSIVGPTIILRPGDIFTLTLVNKLGDETDESIGQTMNTIHYPNTTNVHTHGLHISPREDDIFQVVAPGDNFTYTYQIPIDHAPGLHWYHAHHHGATTLQVANGLVGALEVLPSQSANIPPSITEADSRILVTTIIGMKQSVDRDSGNVSQACCADCPCDPIAQAPLCTGEEVSSPYNPFRISSLVELEAESRGLLHVDPVITDPTIDSNTFLINGVCS